LRINRNVEIAITFLIHNVRCLIFIIFYFRFPETQIDLPCINFQLLTKSSRGLRFLFCLVSLDYFLLRNTYVNISFLFQQFFLYVLSRKKIYSVILLLSRYMPYLRILRIELNLKFIFHSSAAGSVPQTSHWQVTTEPAFVTKQKPSSLSSVSSSFSSSLPTSFSSSSSSSSSSSKPITAITVPETVRIPSLGTSSHFWSNSWTPPRPSLKPHWTDSPSLLQNGPENFPPKSSLKPTESQQVRVRFSL